MSHDYLGFENTLDEDDYGFILDQEGNLKGIWVPQGQEDEEGHWRRCGQGCRGRCAEGRQKVRGRGV